MNYQEIRDLITKDKRSVNKKAMQVIRFKRFSVISSDKTDGIIIDSDLADIFAKRRWCIDSGGYPVANVEGNLIRIFDCVLALNGIEKPSGCYVDHINQDKLDNRIINLRIVTPIESSLNMPLKSNNTSGHTGVTKTKYGTYRAYITKNKKRIDLGQYKTIEEAINARREAEDRLGFITRPQTIKEKCVMENGNANDNRNI